MTKRSSRAADDFDLIAGMLDRAEAHAHADAEKIKRLLPVSRVLLGLAIVALLAAGITTIYGIWNHLDAPITPTPNGYASKAGQPRAREDYESYVAWSRAMFITYPAAIGLFFLFGLQVKFRHRG